MFQFSTFSQSKPVMCDSRFLSKLKKKDLGVDHFHMISGNA